MQATENVGSVNRFLSQSSAIDVGDVSIVFMKYWSAAMFFRRSRSVNTNIGIRRFRFSRRASIRTAAKASTQGVAPYTCALCNRPDGQKFANGPTDWLTGVPTITNADTLGIRPDLVGRPIDSWADLISPEFKGKAALQDQPTVGVIDVAMAVEASGHLNTTIRAT